MVRVAIDATAIPASLTGAGRYVTDLVNALDARDDVALDVFTRRADGARWRTAAPSATVVEAAPRSRVARLAWEQVGLPRRLRRLAVDVHHGPHYTMPLRARVPVVVTVHDMTFFDHPDWHERSKVPVFTGAISTAARRAAAIVCVSETTAARFRDRFPSSAPVHAIPHGVDHARFRPDGDRVADYGRYIAFVGTLEPRKDVAGLIAAFDVIAGDLPDLSLVIAGGKGWGDTGIDAALSTARHRDRVRLLGYVDDAAVAPLLRGAAAVAYPSRDEGFGLPVLEALACGAPVVTTAGTAMEEVAGDAALLVPPGDVGALAAALATAASGGAAAHRDAGIARAARFTWAASAAAHAAVYRSVG
jgi:glycosyltransferase involved in cell wall biosynthesis